MRSDEPKHSSYLIDPPSPFAPVDQWRAFRDELAETIATNGDAPDLQLALSRADEHLRSVAGQLPMAERWKDHGFKVSDE